MDEAYAGQLLVLAGSRLGQMTSARWWPARASGRRELPIGASGRPAGVEN